MNKREFLKTSALATAGAFVGGKVLAREQSDAAGIKIIDQFDPEARRRAQERKTKLNGPVTAMGKIKDLTVSRLIMGGNQLGGWLHARDLRYLGDLAKAYLSDNKMMEIFQMAENCGINTVQGNNVILPILNKYWGRGIGKIQYISDCGGQSFADGAKAAIDGGACAGYCQGENADRWVEAGDYGKIEEGLNVLRNAGLPAGIGAHHIETLKKCVEHGLIPDFWYKTMHHLNYWSAMPDKERRDNRFCEDAEEAAAWFETRKEPFVAFKVLAAGAIPPEDGIRFGLENGGDFVCLGMFDFNMIEDINIFNEVIKDLPKRKRPWCA